MHPKSDAQLLQDYARHGAEAAFTELVQRHTNLVYSAALRQVESPEVAAEIAQNVFVGLAGGAHGLAPRLAPEASLAGWLCRSARNLSLNHRRDEFRRLTRERLAMEQFSSIPEESPNWEHLRCALDEAMAELDDTDYDALVMRFFQKQDFRTVGAAIGVSDDTAQKRVTRALDKLRDLLAQRSIRTTVAALAAIIPANAVQAAPVGLATTISAAVLTGTTLATTATLTATKAIAMTTLQKTIVGATIAVLAGVSIYEARQASTLRQQVQTLEQQRTPSPTTSSNAALSTLQEELAQLALQNAALTNALTLANADKTRLEMEREQAKRAAALHKELAALTNSKNTNPTNAYPTARHVWVGWGRLGRVAALSKEDASQFSPEEKSALEAARMQVLDELPNLVKAAKQFAAAKTTEADSQPGAVSNEVMDMITCILYGALNLDEQQFNQVYGVMQNIKQQMGQKVYSKETPPSEIAEYLEQWKAETQPLLTPEQARIFAEVVTHFQFAPGKFSFNFNMTEPN